MSIEPSTPGEHDDADEHPIVSSAVEALRAFGDELDRATAARLLSMWRDVAQLSRPEYAAVLHYFPAAYPAQPVPHGADRLAEAGELCTCGRPAIVIFETAGYGDVGFCGVNRH